MTFTVLYILWGVMYALTAALGFTTPEGMMVYIYEVLAGMFFIPPWLILQKANREGEPRHTSVVRFLAIAWLGATAVLMVLNIKSAMWSEAVGNALNAALTIASAPLVCGQLPIISLMMWGILLMGSMSRPTNTSR